MKRIWLLMLWLCCLIPARARAPQLAGEIALAIDVDTREIMFAKGNIDLRMYPASITKVMTALLLVEARQPEELLIYSAGAKAVDPYKLDLHVGDHLLVRDALDAVLIFSANDIAFMVAENVGGSVEGFAGLMNRKAAELGLLNTHFVNPSGLHHRDHYSTAYDLSLLIREMYRYPRLMQSTCKIREVILSLEGDAFELKNRNKLVLTGGCVGGKTGWTPEAGRCLAALYERGGRRIAGVVLNSIYDPGDTVVFRDMEKLSDWVFGLGREELFRAGEVVEVVHTRFKALPFIGPETPLAVPLVVNRGVREYEADPDLSVDLEIPSLNPWQLRKNREAGHLVVRGREIEHRYPLFPALSWFDLLKSNWLFYGLVLSSLAFLGAVTTLLFSRIRQKTR